MGMLFQLKNQFYVKKKEKIQYLPENDQSLPRSDRRLAKAERESRVAASAFAATNRASVVARIERLYVDALRDDRITDADYYRKTLKSLYPDWEYRLEQSGKTEEKSKE